MIHKLLSSLSEQADDWNTLQRFRIATLLAKDGDTEARQAIYASYRESSWQVDDCLVELDGIDGFLYVAQKIGILPNTDDARRSAINFFERSMERCGEAPLREAIENTPAIAAFRQAVADGKAAEAHPPPRLTGEELLAMARSLPSLQDPEQIAARLRLFRARPFPLDAGIVLAFLDHPDQRVQRAALGRLKYIRDPRIRALAFDPSYRHDAAHLLAENYQPGDEKIVAAWIEEALDPEELHSLGMGALHFFKGHPHPEIEVPIWELLYEKGPCGFCRGSAVRRLLALHALSPQLRDEAAWDALPDTRQLVTIAGEAVL